jgi:hypothetical protein
MNNKNESVLLSPFKNKIYLLSIIIITGLFTLFRLFYDKDSVSNSISEVNSSFSLFNNNTTELQTDNSANQDENELKKKMLLNDIFGSKEPSTIEFPDNPATEEPRSADQGLEDIEKAMGLR